MISCMAYLSLGDMRRSQRHFAIQVPARSPIGSLDAPATLIAGLAQLAQRRFTFFVPCAFALSAATNSLATF